MENDYRIYATREKSHWGPIYWDFLYLTAMAFPVTLTPEQNRHFSDLIQNFHHFLPCPECRHNYKREVATLDTNIKNKNQAFDVILHLHNLVRSNQRKTKLCQNEIIDYHYRKSTKNKYVGSVILILSFILTLRFIGKQSNFLR